MLMTLSGLHSTLSLLLCVTHGTDLSLRFIY